MASIAKRLPVHCRPSSAFETSLARQPSCSMMLVYGDFVASPTKRLITFARVIHHANSGGSSPEGRRHLCLGCSFVRRSGSPFARHRARLGASSGIALPGVPIDVTKFRGEIATADLRCFSHWRSGTSERPGRNSHAFFTRAKQRWRSK